MIHWLIEEELHMTRLHLNNNMNNRKLLRNF